MLKLMPLVAALFYLSSCTERVQASACSEPSRESAMIGRCTKPMIELTVTGDEPGIKLDSYLKEHEHELMKYGFKFKRYDISVDADSTYLDEMRNKLRKAGYFIIERQMLLTAGGFKRQLEVWRISDGEGRQLALVDECAEGDLSTIAELVKN